MIQGVSALRGCLYVSACGAGRSDNNVVLSDLFGELCIGVHLIALTANVILNIACLGFGGFGCAYLVKRMSHTKMGNVVKMKHDKYY